jgi:hypothetical protein
VDRLILDGHGARRPVTGLDRRVALWLVAGVRRQRLELVAGRPCRPVTWPKTVCLPSSHGAASVVTRKNCEPFVFGPGVGHRERAADDLVALNSSSKV